MTRLWTVLVGDCRERLADLAEESVDAVVTDTPYGLSTVLDPPNLDREALWTKIVAGLAEPPIRVLLRSWLDAGENPPLKGKGFMGKEWDALVPPPNTWRAVWRVLKPGAALLAFGGTRTDDLIKVSLRLADFEVDDTLSWLYGQGFPKRVRLDLKIDQQFGKAAERPVLGKHPAPNRNNNNKTMGDGWGDAPSLTSAATPEAARFAGWDRHLRPGWEPVVLARKPLRGTVAANALAHRTGGLNVDGCRLPRDDAGETIGIFRHEGGRRTARGEFASDGSSQTMQIHARGGYPANVAMDEDVAAMLDAQSGVSRSHASGYDWAPSVNDNPVRIATNIKSGVHFDDRGGASRFFYVAKASSSERDAGLEDMPALTAGERCDREDGTAGINGYAGTRGDGGRNPHPTVKPITLMRWLVRLVSPPGAWDPDEAKRPVVLDPFAGSGSTLVAGLREGVRVVGCELSPEYAEVARRRCQHAYALPRDDEPTGSTGSEPREPTAPRGQRSLF